MDNRRTMVSESKRLSLGALTSSNTVGKTIAGTTITNKRTDRTGNAKSQSEHWIKSKGLKTTCIGNKKYINAIEFKK